LPRYNNFEYCTVSQGDYFGVLDVIFRALELSSEFYLTIEEAKSKTFGDFVEEVLENPV
jgi:hypothetical protein